jgi:hypothetical protein
VKVFIDGIQMPEPKQIALGSIETKKKQLLLIQRTPAEKPDSDNLGTAHKEKWQTDTADCLSSHRRHELGIKGNVQDFCIVQRQRTGRRVPHIECVYHTHVPGSQSI